MHIQWNVSYERMNEPTIQPTDERTNNTQVQELCRDFCTRYIACLRGKMQSENLLRSDYPLEHNNNLSNSNSPVHTPDHVSTLN